MELIIGILIGIFLCSTGKMDNSSSRGVIHCKPPTYPRPPRPFEKERK